MSAGGQPAGDEAAGLVAADRAAPGAGHVAVAHVDLAGRAAGSDAKFDDPLRRPGPGAPTVLFLGSPPLKGGDLVVDAPEPQQVPGT